MGAEEVEKEGENGRNVGRGRMMRKTKRREAEERGRRKGPD